MSTSATSIKQCAEGHVLGDAILQNSSICDIWLSSNSGEVLMVVHMATRVTVFASSVVVTYMISNQD